MTSCAAHGCPPIPPRSTVNHCTGCHQTFGALSAFDSHQDWTAGKLTCAAPESLGLHRDHQGTWRYPKDGRIETLHREWASQREAARA